MNTATDLDRAAHLTGLTDAELDQAFEFAHAQDPATGDHRDPAALVAIREERQRRDDELCAQAERALEEEAKQRSAGFAGCLVFGTRHQALQTLQASADRGI